MWLKGKESHPRKEGSLLFMHLHLKLILNSALGKVSSHKSINVKHPCPQEGSWAVTLLPRGWSVLQKTLAI